MSYREGRLEVTSQVRSVPLGQKRKRGRPKGLGNCLLKSPPNTKAPVPPSAPGSPSVPPSAPGSPSPTLSGHSSTSTTEDFEDTGIRKTTRKRKRKDNLNATSLVSTLASQSRSLEPGLGVSKPPKKKARNEPARSEPARREPARTEPARSESTRNKPAMRVEKPKPLKCKKKSGTCKHQIVFTDHYDSESWKVYADYVKSQKSTTLIDPTYNP